MVDAATVRRLAGALPEAADESAASALRFTVRGKLFAWSYLERVAPKQPRRPRLDVLAVRCAPEAKAAILESDPAVFFTEDHYRGYPAVLVRLDAIGARELSGVLLAAWRCQAPRALVKAEVDRG